MKKEDLPKLTEKFNPMDIEWRVQRADKKDGKVWAMVLAYVDARAIQDRLDSVCGPQNWMDSYTVLDKGILCTLSIKVDGEWIHKTNGSPETDIEGFKGGISKSLVRAASTWGIGRYLYNLEATFAQIVDKKSDGTKSGQLKDKTLFNWIPPQLPKWALPETPKGAEKKEEPKKELRKPLGTQPICDCGSVVIENEKNGTWYCKSYLDKTFKGQHAKGIKDITEYHAAFLAKKKAQMGLDPKGVGLR